MFVSNAVVIVTVSLLQISQACNNIDEDQPSFRDGSPISPQSFDLTANALPPHYYNSQIRGRTPALAESRVKNNGQPLPLGNRLFSFPAMFASRGFSTQLFGNGNIVNPLALLSTRSFVPYDSCSSPNGVMGICTSSVKCTQFRGTASGSCLYGNVCCVNVATNCGGTVSLNNTYWQSPTTGITSTTTSCALTVKLDTKLTEQTRPICQVRLDFVSFSISQPDGQSVCTSDTFNVGGQRNKVPTICGDNPGQHMYLNVLSSATNPADLQLRFNFGTNSNPRRAWNILISMLPCDANYLAPIDCLQYFSSSTGRVSSFNWIDVAGTNTRQLANQDYTICFARSLGANEMCFSACTISNGGDAFSITTPTSANAITADAAVTRAAAIVAVRNTAVTNAQNAVNAAQTAVLTATALTLANAQANLATAQTALTNAQTALATAQANLATATANAAAAANAAALLSGVGTTFIDPAGITTASCLYDYVLISGGRDANNVEADRYCGNAINPAPAGSATSVKVCTRIKPFRMSYQTDGTEAAVSTGTVAPADVGNVGFCLDFQQK